MPLEKDLEARCRKLALAHDGELLKFTPKRGWHDRLLLLPGYLALVEFKRDAKAKKQSLQNDRQMWCLQRRIPAFQIHTYAGFEYLVKWHLVYDARGVLVKSKNET